MQIKILKDRPTMFGVGGNDKWGGDCSPLFFVCYGHVQTFQNLGGGPNALLAPPNENLGGPVPLVSTGSGPHVTKGFSNNVIKNPLVSMVTYSSTEQGHVT